MISINYKIIKSHADRYDELKIKELVYAYKYLKSQRGIQKAVLASPSGGAGGDPITCGENCNNNNDDLCQADELGMSYSCQPKPPGPCDDEEALAILHDETEIDDEDLDELWNISYVEDFRDDFLVNSVLGRFYLRSYYLINSATAGNLDLNIAMQLYDIRSQLLTAMVKIQDPGTYGSDVLISIGLASDITDLLEDVKALNSEPNFENLVEDIEADVDYFKNKSVNTVLADF